MHPHVRSFIVNRNHHTRSVVHTTAASDYTLDYVIIGVALVPTTVFFGYLLVRLVCYIKQRIRKRVTQVTVGSGLLVLCARRIDAGIDHRTFYLACS